MAKRIKFTATFADGTTLTRTSDRKEYTHAWRVKGERGPIPADWNADVRAKVAEQTPEGQPVADTGFATREDLARKAAQSALSVFTAPTRGKYAASFRRYFGSSTQRPLVNVRVEVVAVTREG